MECLVSAFSRVGGRERNEDACGYLEKDGIFCCVLADGAGGHRGGDIASRICVQTVLEEFAKKPEVSTAVISDMLNSANEAVLKQQQEDVTVNDMRSTLVVLLFNAIQRSAVWGHVGDSRLYFFRNGAISLRTRDHSLVQTMLDSGLLQKDDVKQHAERNILIASIGSSDGFQPTVLAAPLTLNDGDAFLICSDGVWNLIEDIDLERSLGCAASSENWLLNLENLVTPFVRKGADNYTALAIWCGEVSENMRTIPAPI